jgi:glutathione S-transferase
LIQTYDKSHLLSYADAPKKFETIQWSYYQASGQGPYFGQAAWFNLFHPEKLESAQARYGNEIKRVAGVLDKVLAGKQWLVGDKCTYADLAFVMWNTNIAYVMNGRPEGWDIEQFPNFKKWQEAMLARDSVKKVLSVLMDKEVKSAGRV